MPLRTASVDFIQCLCGRRNVKKGIFKLKQKILARLVSTESNTSLLDGKVLTFLCVLWAWMYSMSHSARAERSFFFIFFSVWCISTIAVHTAEQRIGRPRLFPLRAPCYRFIVIRLGTGVGVYCVGSPIFGGVSVIIYGVENYTPSSHSLRNIVDKVCFFFCAVSLSIC